MPVPTYTVTVTGVYANAAGTHRKFFANDVIAMTTAYEYSLPGATTPSAPDVFNIGQDAYVDAGDAATLAAAVAADAVIQAAGINAKLRSEARTATAAPGGTTGVITDNVDFVVVTSDDANKVITLPTPTPGTVVALSNGATGYELRSSAPATVAINGGAASNAESAILANTLVICVCRTATAWLCTNTTTAGVASATEVAA